MKYSDTINKYNSYVKEAEGYNSQNITAAENQDSDTNLNKSVYNNYFLKTAHCV